MLLVDSVENLLAVYRSSKIKVNGLQVKVTQK
jgi:hypothetical protein